MNRAVRLVFILIIASACTNHVETNRDSEIIEVPLFGEGIAEVKTTHGIVAGYIDGGAYVYKGIRYAKADRFMPPVEPDSWDGVLSTREYGPTCPQGHHTIGSDEDEFSFRWNDGVFDEDCLRLNIWTPGINDGKKRPVMLWIHGGGYAAGSGQQLPAYDGTNLSRKGNVVVITVNHRLNVLGFLDLSSFGSKYLYSGNVGLMDLVAALNWVHDNIESFGGDPGNVMIMGQSGGGGKVSHLLTMPSAKGLFHKACVQSGSSLYTEDAAQSRELGEAFVKASGMDPGRLETVPYDTLFSVAEKVGGVMRFSPHVDGALIPMQLEEALRRGASKDVPMIIGSNFNEFSVDVSNEKVDMDMVRTALESTYGNKSEEFISLFKKAYPDSEPRDYLELDTWARPNALAQASAKASQGGSPVYLYQFMYMSPSFSGTLRCPHNMEIPFFFDNVAKQYALTGGTADAQILGHRMSDLWISFAWNGVPVSEGLPQWKPYSDEHKYTLQLGKTIHLVEGHDEDLLSLMSGYVSLDSITTDALIFSK